MKKVVAIIVVLAIIVAGAVYVAGKNNDDNKNPSNSTSQTPTESTPTETQNNTSTTDNTPSNTNAVTIENMAFTPASITVKKGTTVTWANKDPMTHTVTEIDGQQGPDSGNLEQGQSYSFTYNTVGTFKYNCSLHTYMTGTVTVTE